MREGNSNNWHYDAVSLFGKALIDLRLKGEE
jgi:hypothetical protein